jgi:hypothetical protein
LGVLKFFDNKASYSKELAIGRAINRKEAFSMTLNTDGISLSDCSSLSIWPC